MSNKDTTQTPKFFTITGTIFYAHVKERDTKGLYPTNAYKLDLSIDDAHKAKLEAIGVQVKNKGDEKGNFVTLKSKNYQPKVVTPDGVLLTESEIPLIGNGSTATITVSLYDNSAANIKAGKGGAKLLGLNKIELTSLVAYQAPSLVEGK